MSKSTTGKSRQPTGYTASLLPNPFREHTALWVAAERLEAAKGQPVAVRALFHGLDVTDPSGLLNYARRIYKGRGRVLRRDRDKVVLEA